MKQINIHVYTYNTGDMKLEGNLNFEGVETPDNLKDFLEACGYEIKCMYSPKFNKNLLIVVVD